MTNQSFAVEVNRRTVGIAVRVPSGFRFYASDGAFEELDGRLFPRVRRIERQLNRIAKRKSRRPKASGRLVPPRATENFIS